MKSKHWVVKESTYALRGPWIKVRADACETPRGDRVEPYYVLEYRDWVNMAVFDEERRIMVIRLYRHGNGQVNLELPAGSMDETDATPEAAARRELLEETGYTSDTFIHLGGCTPNSATHDNTVHSFAVLSARRVAEPKMEATEDIEVEFLEIPEMLRRIDDGAFRQALHIATVHLALRHLGLLKLEGR